jgi:hypothetical protein
VVADDRTIDNGKVSEGSKDGIQQRQRATSLQAWEDAEDDGGVGGACWMIVECRVVGRVHHGNCMTMATAMVGVWYILPSFHLANCMLMTANSKTNPKT